MAKQYEFKFHGGKRKNAGRKNKTGQPAHTKRPKVDFRKPLHVTLKCTPTLQKTKIYNRMKHACRRAKTFGLHIIQFSMLADHIHMIVEAKNNASLASGIKSITGTLAKRFAKRFKRYHLRVITSPRQMRNTYKYVLLNYSKHTGEPNHIDDYSTGSTFRRWDKLAEIRGDFALEEPDTYGLVEPKSWLATKGWRRSRTA